MTKQEAIKILVDLTKGNNEVAHLNADVALVDFLRDNGFADVADAYDDARKRVGFWYA